MAVKVRERKDKWWVFIDHNGHRKAKCVGDRRSAIQVAEKIRAKLALGEFGFVGDRDRRPFDTYFRNWLETYVRGNCKPSTYACYETAFRVYLAPAFGQKDIARVRR